MLLLIALLLTGLDCLLGAPTGREVYMMPQNALKGNFYKPRLVLFFVNYLSNILIYVTNGDKSRCQFGNQHLKYECGDINST